MANGWGQGQSGTRLCSKCQRPLNFVAQYNQWYCYNCGTYEASQVAQTGDDVQPQRTELKCRTCGDTLYFIRRYGQHYCYKCNVYTPVSAASIASQSAPIQTQPVAPGPSYAQATTAAASPAPQLVDEAKEAAAAPAEAPLKCPECGTQVEQGWIRCPSCGNALETSDIPERPVTTPDERPSNFHSTASTVGQHDLAATSLPHSEPKETVPKPWEARHGGEFSWEPQAMKEEQTWSEASQRQKYDWQASSTEERKDRDLASEEQRSTREEAAKDESMAYRRGTRAEADDRSQRVDDQVKEREESTVSERRIWEAPNEPVTAEPMPHEGAVPDEHAVKPDSEMEFLIELFEGFLSSLLKEPVQPVSFYRSKLKNLADRCETIRKVKLEDDGKVHIYIKALDFNKTLSELAGMLDSIIETEAKISSRAQAMARAREALEPIVKEYREEIDDLGIGPRLLNKAFATKLPSGVPGFDDMLHGGIPNGASIILQGPSSGEKDVLANQFLGCGLDENGSVMIVLTMISPDEWRTQMRSIGQRLSDYEKEGQIVIVDWYTQKNERVRSVEVRGSVVLSSKSITNLEIAIDKAIKSIKDAPTKRAVIAILSPAIKALGFDTIYGFAQSIRGKFKKYNITGLFLLDKGMHDQNVVTSLQSVFDGVFDIERERVGDSMVTRLGILSMKGMTFESKYRELELTKEGLAVKPMQGSNGQNGAGGRF